GADVDAAGGWRDRGARSVPRPRRAADRRAPDRRLRRPRHRRGAGTPRGASHPHVAKDIDVIWGTSSPNPVTGVCPQTSPNIATRVENLRAFSRFVTGTSIAITGRGHAPCPRGRLSDARSATDFAVGRPVVSF